MQIHVIIGDDDYLVGETARKIVGDGTGLEVIDSVNSTNQELQLADLRRADESLSTPPFLDPRKVTWWKNVAFLPGGKSSEEVKSSLERFAQKLASLKLPENQHFILSGPKLLKTSIFAKRLTGAVELVTFAADKPWEAARNAAARAEDFAAELGLKFVPGASDRFVAIVGTDARSQVSELNKMRDYLGPGVTTITEKDVAEITSPGAKVEALPWDVTEAIGERNASKALGALHKFELQKGFDVFMSGVIEKFFRQLIDFKEGRTEGMNPNALRKNALYDKKWTLRELRIARARFISLREKVVSGTTAGGVLIVTELVRALRPARPPR